VKRSGEISADWTESNFAVSGAPRNESLYRTLRTRDAPKVFRIFRELVVQPYAWRPAHRPVRNALPF
jgi:hypothetical protein